MTPAEKFVVLNASLDAVVQRLTALKQRLEETYHDDRSRHGSGEMGKAAGIQKALSELKAARSVATPGDLPKPEADRRLQEAIHVLAPPDADRVRVLLGLLRRGESRLVPIIHALFLDAPVAKGAASLRAFRSRFNKSMRRAGVQLQLATEPTGRTAIENKRLVVTS